MNNHDGGFQVRNDFLRNICLVLKCFQLNGDLKEPFIISLRTHRMPLYFIPVSVRLRLARTLLKRLLSKNLNFKSQFTHASRHPGALSLLQKLKIG